MEAASRLAASQWGLRGSGAAIGLQAEFDALPEVLRGSGLATGFFDITVGGSVFALVAISAVQVIAMSVRLARER
jgi:hypothetical protein